LHLALSGRFVSISRSSIRLQVGRREENYVPSSSSFFSPPNPDIVYSCVPTHPRVGGRAGTSAQILVAICGTPPQPSGFACMHSALDSFPSRPTITLTSLIQLSFLPPLSIHVRSSRAAAAYVRPERGSGQRRTQRQHRRTKLL